ncbi:MAG: hypothetical protein ABJE95_38855 [Byssovorax sp.]
MLAISESWLGAQRAAFESIPEIKALIGKVDKGHAALTHARPSEPTTTDPAVLAISTEQRALDIRHDHALRAVYYAHEALAEHLLAQDPPEVELAAAVRAACGRLLPDGLSGTIASYQAESGNASRALEISASDPEIKSALTLIHVTKKVGGHDLLAQWAAIGAHLGALEQDKSAAIAEAGAAVDPRAPLLTARNGWINIVSSVLRVLNHASEPAAAIDTIRRSVTEPAAKAAKRHGATRKAIAAKAALAKGAPKLPEG